MTCKYLLISRNIHQNLAMEECHFRAGKSGFLFYINDPAVVIGRFQNPWQECDLGLLTKNHISLARRSSGGGAVYHDAGNLCISLSGTLHSGYRCKNLELVVDVLSQLGINAKTSEKGDILLNKKKISGSAYKESRGRFLHHLTLLFHADLKKLSGFLAPSFPLTGRFTESRRSAVTNIHAHHPSVSMTDFIECFSKQAGLSYTPQVFDESEFDGSSSGNFENIFEKTPAFRFSPSPEIEVTTTNGYITGLKWQDSFQQFEQKIQEQIILDKTAILDFLHTNEDCRFYEPLLLTADFIPSIRCFYN